ncbi:MAG: efflux transporter outer membrane subunit [Persicimonas sp.]
MDIRHWFVAQAPISGGILAAKLLAALVATWLGAAAGCSSSDPASKADEVVDTPDGWRNAPLEAKPLEGWCTDFDAPELEELVELAFDQNLELHAAWARLEQSRAIARQQGASLWPWLSGSASATRQKIDFGSRFGDAFSPDQVPPGGEDQAADTSTTTTFDTYQASVAASYELDLWGRIRSQRDAAQLDALATRAQAESLAMTLTSQIAENWLEMVYQRERIALIEEQVETSERFYELTLLRLRQGESTALDVTQQRQNLESLRGQVALARGSEETARNQLAVLVGRSPAAEVELDRQRLPELAPVPDPGVPADLVGRRPDVRAAFLRIGAADERVEAAVAERLPQIQLSADLSVQANEIANLFEQLLWSVSASLSQPIFQGGRITAQIDQAEAVARESVFNYAQTLLTAMREVQDALILEDRQREFTESLAKQVDSAQSALELARDRYRLGAFDYLRVLDAIGALQQAEQSLLDARRQRLSTRVRLCRALGGSWTRQLDQPAPEEQPVEQPVEQP